MTNQNSPRSLLTDADKRALEALAKRDSGTVQYAYVLKSRKNEPNSIYVSKRVPV